MKHQPYKTVKTKLKNVIIDPQNIARIQRDLESLNKATILVYQLIKALCLDLFEKNLNFPNIDKKFITSCFRAVCIRSNTGREPKDKQLVTELEVFSKQVFGDYQKPNLVGLYTALEYRIIEMETCYTNNIFMHFPARLRKFIKCNIPLNGTKSENQRRVWAVYNSLVRSDPSLFPEDIAEWYELYRFYLLPEKIAKCLEYDLKVNPFNYLFHMIFMDRGLEENGYKTFAAFPLKDSAIPSYIRLDTSYFGYNFFKTRNITKEKQWVRTYREEIFDNIFKMKIRKKDVIKENKLFKKNRYHFHHMIMTNGYTANLIFERNGYVAKKKESDNEEEDAKYGHELDEQIKANFLARNVVGADPGKYNLLYLTDGKEKLRYTKNQRMHETGEKKYAKLLLKQRRETGIEELESTLSQFNRNTCFYNKFVDYVRAKNEILTKTFDFYSQTWIRAWDFRKFRLKQKSEDKFLNKVEKTFGKDCVISYGDWKGNNQLRNQKSTLGIGMRRIIEKKFDIFLTDEYRSSQLHYWCDNRLKNAVIDGQKKHRCLECSSCKSRFEDSSSQSERSVFVNRDYNAALNICYLGKLSLQNHERPLHFQRGFQLP